MDCCPKRMSRSAPDASNKAAASIITKRPAKLMSRSAKSSPNLPSGKEAVPVEVRHTNWRAKNREDPRQVEYKQMLSGMGFANL